MKRIALLALFALVAFTPLANSQNTTCSLIPGACGERYARQAYASVDRFVGQRNQQAQNYQNYDGYDYSGGSAYGSSVGIGVGGRVGGIVAGVAIGAGVGYAFGGTRGALIGGGISGGVVGLGEFLASRSSRGSNGVDCSKRKLNRKEQEICNAAAQNALAEQQQALQQQQENAVMAERRLRGGFLANKTPYNLMVMDGDQRVCVIKPGGRVSALEAINGYEGIMLVPSQTPGLREEHVAAYQVASNNGGWNFHAPCLTKPGAKPEDCPASGGGR